MPTDRCRILIFTQNDWFFHLHFLPLGQALVDAGIDVVLTCLVNDHREQIENLGIRVQPMRSLNVRSLGVVNQLRTLAEVIGLMRRERPDIALLISPKPIVLGSLAAVLTKVPVTLSLMTGLGFLFMDNSLRTRILRKIVESELGFTHARIGRRILFQNTSDRDAMIAAGMIDEHKSPIVGGVGTNLDRFSPGARNNDLPVIVFGARMLRDKGVVELVEAARLLQERGVRCRVQLCGDPDPGNPSSLSKVELTAWHKAGLVEWLGHVDDIERILATADIACLPSYREGMPKFLLDAAAAGLPLVTTDVPGCKDVVENDVNGLLVPKCNSIALADAMAELIADPQRCEAMGQASRKRAELEFAHDAFVQRMFKTISDVASEAGLSACRTVDISTTDRLQP